MATSSLPDSLLKQVMQLTEDQREELACWLIESAHEYFESCQDEEWKSAVVQTARERAAARDAGEPGISWDDINRQIDEMMADED